LTAREQQVLELVEHGMKNREIAKELGIRPGTVKIHLKHIFEKTGVRGRYGLALTGLKEKGVFEMASPAAGMPVSVATEPMLMR
jgi:DNA-binding NarL/FixJ family response regulator